jgi:FkbM family methyltransferase
MLKYIKNSFKRKIARRVTKEYPVRIDTFNLKEYGAIQFANWINPLVDERIITDKNIGFIKKFLQKGDVAIDIGANIGNVSITFSIITGKDGATISFDPNPYVYKILKINSELNPGLINIQPYNYAITDEPGEFFYNSSEASFNNGGISKQKESVHGKYALSHKITGIKLESFLEKHYSEKLNKLRLIKVDTEGSDKEIIKSIKDLLKKYKPALIAECFGKLTMDERFEYFDMLTSLGYSLFHFSDFTDDAVITPLTIKEDMMKWKHFDFYAINK